jgi:epoxyqueuosine reductase QueG
MVNRTIERKLSESQKNLRRLKIEAAKFMDGPANDNHSKAKPEKAFERPFFGVVAGDDPYWESIGQAAGERHWRPLEAFLKAYPESGALARDLSVVVIVCPQTRATVADQGTSVGFPSERWVRSRFYHDQVIGALCDSLAESLISQGLKAVVPDHLSAFKVFPHDRFQVASNWSHRHAGFGAGLGTFGLCDALITKVGKAHRLGSIIVNCDFEANPRPYQGIYEYCLFSATGSCGKCIGRCPAGAISHSGHDKTLCSDFLDSTTPIINKMYPDLEGGYGCGLCQSNVPCGDRTPGSRLPGRR